MTQTKFAKFLGFSHRSGIEKYERGSRKIPPETADKIASKTGVMPSSIMRSRGHPIDLMGRRYTPKSFKDWQTVQSFHGPLAIKITRGCQNWLTALFCAAADSRHFIETKFNFQGWLVRSIKENKLERAFDEHLKILTQRAWEKEMPLSELRSNTDLANKVDLSKHDRQSWNGSTSVKIRWTMFEFYAPTEAPNSVARDKAVVVLNVRWFKHVFCVSILKKQWKAVWDVPDLAAVKPG